MVWLCPCLSIPRFLDNPRTHKLGLALPLPEYQIDRFEIIISIYETSAGPLPVKLFIKYKHNTPKDYDATSLTTYTMHTRISDTRI